MKIAFFFVMAICISFHSLLASAQEINLHKYADTPQSVTMVRIASVSVFPEKWDKQTNWAHIEPLVRKAAEVGARLVVTPEGALDGYVINQVNNIEDASAKEETIKRFMQLGEPLDGAYIKKAAALAKELQIFFVLGFLERSEGLLYNTVVLFDPEGGIIGKYSKTHFAQGYSINPSCYLAGEEYPVYQTPFGKIGMLICYDRQLPEPARILAVKGAQILLFPSYGSYTDENGWNTVMMRTRAHENQAPVVFCHPKQNLLLNEDGDIIQMTGTGEVAWYDVNTSPERYEGRFRNRRPPTYRALIEGGDPAQ